MATATKKQPDAYGAAVISYDGKRGRVWRIKYVDVDGRQVMETIGAERDGGTRKKAEAELRERQVNVERKGWRKPATLTLGASEAWREARTGVVCGGVPGRSPRPGSPTT